MTKPRVSVLIDQTALNRGVMSPAAWARLRARCRVQFSSVDPFDAVTLRRTIRDADAVVTSWGTPRLSRDLLDLAPRLKLIAHAAGSIRPVVSDEVWERKIWVTSAAPAIAANVAEYAVGCLILGLRRLMANRQHVAAHRWGLDHESGRMKSLAGARIGVVGAGYVGRKVIELLRAFQPQIAVYDPFLSRRQADELGVAKLGLLRLAAWSDAVTLHAPELPQTRGMIGVDFIRALRPHSLLVNTARGSLIDEPALVERLRRGDLAAMLDVTDPEPPARANPLRRLPNVLLTPHVAGAGDFGRLGELAVSEVERVLAGERPQHAISREKMESMA